MSSRNTSLLCCWLALSNNKQSYKLQNKLKMAKLCLCVLCVQRHTFLIYKEFNLIKIQTLYDAFVKQSISHFRQKNTNWIHNLCIAIWKLAFFRKCIESIGKFKKYRIIRALQLLTKVCYGKSDIHFRYRRYPAYLKTIFISHVERVMAY